MSLYGATAVRYARDFGWHVFPINPQSKRPVFSRFDDDQPDHAQCSEGECGHKHATTDAAVLAAWWDRWPEAWIGLWCAASGLVVVDVDPRNGGRIPPGMPDTHWAKTRSGGTHLYYRASAGSEFPGELSQGVDLKYNGYVVVAPSPGYSWGLSVGPIAPWPGKRWRTAAPYQGPREAEYDGPGELSPEALACLRPYGDELTAAVQLGTGRNNALFILARVTGQLVAGGEIKEAAAREWLERLGRDLFVPGARATVRSGFEKGLKKDRPRVVRPDADGWMTRGHLAPGKVGAR